MGKAEEKFRDQKELFRLLSKHVGHKLDCAADEETAAIGCRDCGVDLLVVRWPGVKLQIAQWEWICPVCGKENHEDVCGDSVVCQHCDLMFEAQP